MQRNIPSWIEGSHQSHYLFLSSMKPLEPWECNDSYTASSSIASTNRIIDRDEIAVFQGSTPISSRKRYFWKLQRNKLKIIFHVAWVLFAVWKYWTVMLKYMVWKLGIFFLWTAKWRNVIYFWLFMTTKVNIFEFFSFNFLSSMLEERKVY